jgi:hypothetical protein
MNCDFVSTIIGVLAGGTLTWLASYIYYRKAGNELRQEANELRTLTELVLYIQLHPNAPVSAKTDKEGKIIGLVVSAVGRA